MHLSRVPQTPIVPSSKERTSGDATRGGQGGGSTSLNGVGNDESPNRVRGMEVARPRKRVVGPDARSV